MIYLTSLFISWKESNLISHPGKALQDTLCKMRTRKALLKKSVPGVTLEPRLPFPDSVGGIFLGPATTQKVYQGINSFEHVD